MKPRVSFFEFTSCEGCQLTVLNCEEELLDLLGKIEIVNFREAASDPRLDDYDIAFVEGSIARESEVARLRQIRDRAKILVALGACAHLGGINLYKNHLPETECRHKVYGKGEGGDSWPESVGDSLPARPISGYVKVDFSLPGCPIHKQEFLNFVRALLRGLKPVFPDYAVCLQCRLQENGCLLLKGQACMGPVTRAGCDAVCPSYGAVCWGCRGTYEDANHEGYQEALKARGFSDSTIEKSYRIFGRIGEGKP